MSNDEMISKAEAAQLRAELAAMKARLPPESKSREPIGILSHGLIGRTRRIGTDANGIPIEESVPARKGLYFYDKDGNRCHTATQCQRATLVSEDAERSAAQKVKQLLGEGFLREDLCPHMAVAYGTDKPKSPVPAPSSWKGCKGELPLDLKAALGGCQCLRDIVLRRRTLASDQTRVRKTIANDAAKVEAIQRLGAAIARENEQQPQTKAGLEDLKRQRRDAAIHGEAG